MPSLQAFNDSAGVFRLGIAQAVLPITDLQGNQTWLAPAIYTEFGTFF